MTRTLQLELLAGATLTALLLALPGAATTVRQTSVDEMLGACELVFEGEALASGVEESPGGRHVFTWVDFAVRDVVKGPAVDDRIRLYFLGGAVGDRIVEVGGMRVPAVGERGLYFVESLARRQVHPFYGWDQGRLRILPGPGGVDRVVSADGRPVVGLAPPNAIRRPRGALSEGVADELELDVGARLEDALSAAELKAQLRGRLAGGS